LTATGAAIGTPEYMAPEQGLEHAVDARVDVYALGVIFYEMVTGQTPYRADTPWAVLLKKSTEPLPSPKKFVPHLPDDVERTLIKALQKDPSHRFQTVGEFLAALERIAEGKQIPEESTVSDHILKRLSFPLAVFGGMCMMGMLVLAAVFLGVNFIRERQTPSDPPQAQSSPPASVSTSPLETETLSPSPSPIATVTQSARISPNDGMELVHVPAGEFIRGASADDIAALFRMCPKCPLDSLLDAQPQAIIHLDAFWMDKTEVTNAQFAKFVDAIGYRTTAETSNAYSYVQDLRLRDFVSVPDAEWRRPQGKNSNINNKGDHAVTQISWQDAAAYCEWAGRRLPTEAEWEKAARGADGRMFPWGNRPPQLTDLNFDFLHGAIVAVGSYPNGASPYGVLDMSGNVWEWVADYYDESYYNNTPGVNPSGPNTGEGRVLRGGSWASEYDPYLVFVTTYYRLWNYEYISSDVLGFRCAISE
jgi:serine/threonine-protein kinase